MSMQNIMAGLAVSDIQTASAWYTKLLGRGPTEMPMDGLLEWEFPGGGWLQVFEDKERAGKGSVTIIDDDLETRVASLETAKIMVTREEGQSVSLAFVEDPDGNRVVFAAART